LELKDELHITTRFLEDAFHMYYEGLHRYAYTLLKENEAAKDAVQQVFANVWAKRSQLHIQGTAKAYLYAAVYNSCMNMITRTQQHTIIDAASAYVTVPDLLAETKELQRMITAAIDGLPPQCKTIFLKSREEGKTYGEIANEMELSVKTVEAQMTKALKILRSELSPYLSVLLVIVYSIITTNTP